MIWVINFYGVGVNGVKAELVATPITPDGTNYTEIEKLQRTTSDIVGDIPAGTAKRKTFNITLFMCNTCCSHIYFYT